jgi:hypothetical protein
LCVGKENYFIHCQSFYLILRWCGALSDHKKSQKESSTESSESMGCADRQNMRRCSFLGYGVSVVVLSWVCVVSATRGSKNYENAAFVGVKSGVFDNKRTSSFDERKCLSPSRLYSTTTTTKMTSGQGFAAAAAVVVKEEKEEEALSSGQVKERLLDLLPRMRGEAEEFRQVESYVNLLEADYEPALTLDFFNLAMGGEWQLLFSTNLSGTVQKIRLRELIQRIDPKQLDGTITNIVRDTLCVRDYLFNLFRIFLRY